MCSAVISNAVEQRASIPNCTTAGKRFLTDCELSGVRYIFESLERGLSDEECREALAKYFATHGHGGEFHRRLREDNFVMIDCRVALIRSIPGVLMQSNDPRLRSPPAQR